MKKQNRLLKNSFSAASIAALLSVCNAKLSNAAGDAALPQLAINTYASQIFWLAVSFTVMYVVFSKKVLPNISEILERRRDTIASDLETAETLREEAESVQAEYEAAIAKAQSDGAELLQELNAKISADMNAEHDRFKETSNAQVQQAEDKAVKASEAMMAELGNEIPALTATIVNKLTGLEPTEKEAQSAVSSQAEEKAKAA
jgi:F-type H+-transporting ATPase subunit b